MVTVDLVVFAFDGETLRSLFIRRKSDPFAEKWAIPGGYLEMEETIEAAALRELKEETGLESLAVVEEIGVYGDPGRDPRGRTISVAYAGVVVGPPPKVQGGDDAKEAAWLEPRKVTDLAFDHEEIVAKALQWLALAMRSDEVAFALLPDLFARKHVTRIFQGILGQGDYGKSWLASRVRLGSVITQKGSVKTYRRAK